jgi:hypothetical protein
LRWASVADFDIGTFIRYRGRLHVVVGVTPIGVYPRLVDLEDVESGRVRRLNPDDRLVHLESVGRGEIGDDDAGGF